MGAEMHPFSLPVPPKPKSVFCVIVTEYMKLTTR